MILLASQSKIRRHILTAAGIRHHAITSPLDEEAAKLRHAQSSPAELALALAKEKAAAVQAPHADDLVIGADQTLNLHGSPLSKPRSTGEARNQLLQLRGQSHQLHSALACVQNGNTVWQHVSTATLEMRNFSDAFLDSYVDAQGQSITESVGGYKLESEGIQLFSKIEGDYFTILGLPLLPLLAWLRETGHIPS